MKHFLQQMRKKLAVGLLAGLSLTGVAGLLPVAVQAADPLPAGKICPPPGGNYSASLQLCTRNSGIDPATNAPTCTPPYTPLQSYDCVSPPIADPAVPPPNTGGGGTGGGTTGGGGGGTCLNPIDKLQGGLCVHTKTLICDGVYLDIGNNQCGTSPALSKPGAENGDVNNTPPTSSQTGNPRCAVMTLGEIACPSNVGAATNNCYLRDPTGKQPAQWVKIGCGSAEFKKASTVYSLDCSVAKTAGCSTTTTCDGSGTKCDIIKSYVDPIVKILSGLVGVGVAATIILSGIQYSASGSSPQQVEAARKRITVAVCVLIGYFLLFAFLNWLIPGGI